MKVSLVYTGVTPELIELVEREVKSQLPADTERNRPHVLSKCSWNQLKRTLTAFLTSALP